MTSSMSWSSGVLCHEPKHVGQVAQPWEFREFCPEKPGKTQPQVLGASVGMAFFTQIPSTKRPNTCQCPPFCGHTCNWHWAT